MINVKVLFFGSAKDLAEGCHDAQVELNCTSPSTLELRKVLPRIFPGLVSVVDNIVMAVNEEYTYVDEAVTLKVGFIYALIICTCIGIGTIGSRRSSLLLLLCGF